MLALVAIAGWAIGQPGKPADDAKKTNAQKEKTTSRSTDTLKNLPPGTVLVICDNLKEAQQLAPNMILLSPKEYDDMRKEIAKLRGQLQAEQATPGECHLSGTVEGELARLRADFKFVTEKDGEQVLLGFRTSQPTGIALDGVLPLFRSTDKGVVLHVEKKGEHSARLDLEVNVGPKGDRAKERGFDLDLPGAAVTSLELDLPAGVKEAAMGITTPARPSTRLVATRPEGDKQRMVQQLGAATGLELSWKGPIAASNADPYLSAQGRITVRVFEQQVVTDGELTLEARGKQVAVWRLHVPPHALVTVKPQSGEERAAAEVEEPNGAADQLRVVRLKDPIPDKVQILVHVEQKREQGAVAIGPFAVEGARRQGGVLLLAAPADAGLRTFLRGMVGPRELSADEQKEFKAAFTYWGTPAADQAGQPYPPLLEVDAESSRGIFEARVLHTLEKTEENWKLTTVLDVTPLTTGVDVISVQLPASYRPLPERKRPPGEPLYDIRMDPGARTLEIQLKQKQSRNFQVTLEGTYPPTVEPMRQAAFELPLPQHTIASRGGHQITILVPETLELETPKALDPGWDVTRLSHYRQRWSTDQLPQRIEISWQPHRQELLLASVADIAISGRGAQVVQQVWFAAAQAPAEVQFRVPENVHDLQVVERGKWNADERTVTLSSDASEKRPLRLRYAFDIKPEGPAAVFPLSLALPGRGARCDTKVRITCEPGTLAQRTGGPWEELPLEPMGEGDEKRLASLVLHGDRPETPPVLRLSEARFLPLATVGVTKALIRVWVGEHGQQSYRASFLVDRVGRYLDIEFPAPPANLNVKIAVAGKEAGWGPVEENPVKAPGNVDASHVARVPLGTGLLKATLVDIEYQLGPAQFSGRSPAWLRAVGPFQTLLQPPRLCGHTNHASVRWQVVLPSDWLLLYENGGMAPEQSWSWRGWLLAARPSASGADLERWLRESEEQGSTDSEAASYPSVTSWRTDLEPLQIVHVQQQVWLLGCSLMLLLVGLGLYFLQPGRLVFWLVVLLLSAAALATSLLWPGVLSAVLYGCEPGLLALFVVLGMQWMLHRRYRHQVVFLPSFKRAKASGSSLVQSGGTRPREPTTVDALPPAPSSHKSKGV
jgi:hypothetical protein